MLRLEFYIGVLCSGLHFRCYVKVDFFLRIMLRSGIALRDYIEITVYVEELC